MGLYASKTLQASTQEIERCIAKYRYEVHIFCTIIIFNISYIESKIIRSIHVFSEFARSTTLRYVPLIVTWCSIHLVTFLHGNFVETT